MYNNIGLNIVRFLKNLQNPPKFENKKTYDFHKFK